MTPVNATDNAGVIAWPPFIFGGCAALSGLLHFLVPLRVMWYPASLSIGLFLAVVSASLALWAERVMKAAGTNVRPDRPTLAIVTAGPYRFTRNPMYLALCLLQVALGFVFDGWIPMVCVIPLALTLHFGVVLREERYLGRKFGQSYVELKRKVRRWL